MLKRSMALFLVICMLSLPTASLAATELKVGYTPGATSYSLPASACTSADGVSVLDNSVSIAAGGRAVYCFYMPFNSRSVTIKYANASGVTTIETGYKTYTLELSGSGEYLLEFGKHLGIQPQENYHSGKESYYYREILEARGEREFTVSTTGGITIESMVFEKEKTPVGNLQGSLDSHGLPDVSDEVMRTVSTVMMDINAPVIVVNGGRRYLDNNDTNLLPYIDNGTLYIPIETLAKALGYYSEDIPDKQYAMMRDDVHEYVWLEDSATIRTGSGIPVPASKDMIIHHNGKTFAAVRYFAELAGETVGYKDGLVVIDDKYTVNDILNDSKLNSFATDFFRPFKASKTNGNTYYVAQTAASSDSNNGSIMAPFKTLAKASSVAKAGDTVIVREGVYRETLAPANDGTAANPITFRAAEGENVVISAADELGNFAHYKDNIYVAYMGWDLGNGKNQLFIGENSMMEARYPNSPRWKSDGLSDLWPIRGDFYAPERDKTTIKSDTLLNQDEADYWKGGTYVGLVGNGYSFSTATIDSSEKGVLYVADTTTVWWPENTGGSMQTWNYGCIIGHMNALDIGNEWVKKDDMVYVIFPDDIDPATAKVEAKARQLVIDIADKKYINIEGFKTIGGSAKLNNSEMCMLNNMYMKYITHYTATNDQRDGYIDFPYDAKNPDGAPQRGEVGIYVGGTDNIIANSHLDHSAGAGIYGSGLYTYIDNNVINDCGYMSSYVSGIHFDTMGTDVANKARGGYALYNNTIYNCGRSAINISMLEKASHEMAAYLPMEIAYNDVHDCMLASLDTGIVYEYSINRAVDKQRTQLHHNYAYNTTPVADENAHSSAFYHDGGSHGSDTHNNMVVTLKDKARFTMYNYFEQSHSGAPGSNNLYNNKFVGGLQGTIADLEASHFPQERCFYAGSKLFADEYLKNYEIVASGNYSLMNNAETAELSEGIELEDGIARFTGNDQYVCFEGVDFGEGADLINFTVYGDRNYSNDTIEVVVGDSIDDGVRRDITVQVSSMTDKSPDNAEVNVGYITGKKNVYVITKDFRSLGLGGVTVAGLSSNDGNAALYAVKTYGGNFTGYDVTETVGQENLLPAAVMNNSDDKINPCVNNTWDGTILKYENLIFSEDAKTFEIAASSAGSWAFQPVELYIDAIEGEPLVTHYVNDGGWSDYTPEAYSLNEVIPAGAHDVYIKFPKVSEAESTKSSNLYYIGFIKASAEDAKDEEEFVITTKVIGGKYDVAESIQNEEQPFVARYVQRPYYKEKGLTNTKPGTTAVYKNVNIKETANAITLHYSSAEHYDGQTVDVRIGSPSSEIVAQFVTKGNGWENFNTETIELPSTLEAGTYDIYLTFGGTKGSVQTCKLHWFGFSD